MNGLNYNTRLINCQTNSINCLDKKVKCIDRKVKCLCDKFKNFNPSNPIVPGSYTEFTDTTYTSTIFDSLEIGQNILANNGNINAVAEDSTTGNIYIAGDIRFNSAGGVGVRGIAMWDGTTWSSLGGGLTGSGIINTLSYNEDSGLLYAAGLFSEIGGVSANNIAAWNGTTWSALTSGTDDEVYALFSIGSNVIVGGDFANAGGSPRDFITGWDGTAWFPQGTTFGSTIDSTVYSIDYDSTNSIIYVGGDFGSPSQGAAAADTTTSPYTWNALGAGTNDTVFAVALDTTNNILYVGGSFSMAGGMAIPHIAQWSVGGGSWSAVGTGLDNQVISLAMDNTNGILYIDGTFDFTGTTNVSSLATWDGTTMEEFLPSSISGGVYLDSNNDVYRFGVYHTLASYEVFGFVKIIPDSSLTATSGSALETYLNSQSDGFYEILIKPLQDDTNLLYLNKQNLIITQDGQNIINTTLPISNDSLVINNGTNHNIFWSGFAKAGTFTVNITGALGAVVAVRVSA